MMLLNGLSAGRTECCWHCSCENNVCCDGRSATSRAYASVMRAATKRSAARVLRGLGAWDEDPGVSAIANKRREGWTDGQITTWMLEQGWSDMQVNAAFDRIAKMTMAASAPAPAPIATATKIPWTMILAGAGILGVVGFALSRR